MMSKTYTYLAEYPSRLQSSGDLRISDETCYPFGRKLPHSKNHDLLQNDCPHPPGIAL